MHIQIETADLSDCLSRMVKVISSPDDLHVVVKDGVCKLSIQKEGFFVSLGLKAKCLEDGHCALDFSSVKTIFRNRKTLELKLEKSQLLFKAVNSKSFAGNLVTLDYTRHRSQSAKTGDKVSSEQMEFLSEALKTLAIEDFYFKHPLSLYIFENSGYAYACVASGYHMAVAEKKLKRVAPMSLPLKCMTSIVSVLPGSIYLSIDESRIIASNKSGDLVVNPLESTDDKLQKDALLPVIKSFPNKPLAKDIGVADIQDVMSAFTALKTPESNGVKLEFKKGGLGLSMRSSKGTLSNLIKCTVKKEFEDFAVNPDMLNSFIRVSDKTDFSLYLTEKSFCLKSEGDGLNVKYIGALRL